MPQGTVNFFEGERYAYADFAFASVLLRSLCEGVEHCGIHYDIMCHYLKKLWERWAALESLLSPLTPDLFMAFVTAIPKFHLAGHTDGCWARFSLNHLFGVGRLDAEGGERCLSNLNHAAGSTIEKGPGSHVDALNQIMHQWNWSKTVSIAAYILRKWNEAVDMSGQQQDAWNEFNSSLNPAQTSIWSSMSTEPVYNASTRQWSSVFALPDPPAISISAKLKELTALETQPGVWANRPMPVQGAALWITTALEVIASQRILKRDIASWGQNPTPRQALVTASRRKSLLVQVQHSHAQSLLYCPVTQPPEAQVLSEEDQGKPELLSVLLPSNHPSSSLDPTAHGAVMDIERQLQGVSALKSLQLVRSACIQLSHFQCLQGKHTKTTTSITRASAYRTRLCERQDHAVLMYNDSCDRLLRLGMSPQDIRSFRPLIPEDIAQLLADITNRRTLGQGHIQLPWYWRVTLSEGPNDMDLISSTSAALDEEWHISLRVEWFRGCERWCRWAEEVDWLEREVASTVLSFDSRSVAWLKRSESLSTQGWKAYSRRQASTWSHLRDQASQIVSPLLQCSSGPVSGLCHRVYANYCSEEK